MKTMSTILAAALIAALASPALGQGQGQGQGHGKGQGQGQGQGQSEGKGQGQGNSQAAGPKAGGAAQGNVVIVERDRSVVYSYYRTEYAGGNCPPGLAKKNNGCLPPGQAKKMWAMGQPLAAGVVFYPLPGVLLAQLTPPPSGYQYVRVANDILMMAIGTRLIVGALADLGSL